MCGRGQGSIITTIAGNGTAGYSGDGGPASNSKLNQPETLCVDKYGNIIIADAANHRIRKIDALTLDISTIAGNGSSGYNGDNIPATNAELFIPDAVATDTFENIYIADALNHRIRKIERSTGLISTICGMGAVGNTGDGGLATNAKFNLATGLCLDQSGNIYIADILNNNLRKIDVTSGTISTVAGISIAGYSGDGAHATNAKLSGPAKVYIDDLGNIFFTEMYNNTIRKVNTSTGIISTIAGNGIAGYSGDGGLAINATLNQPYGIFVDKQYNIFIADWGNGSIRKIDGSTGIITTIAGLGIKGFSGDDGLATNAKLQPDGVWVDKYGTIFIADMGNNRIRKVYNPLLAINTPSLTIEDIHIYPNPARNEITITAVTAIEKVSVTNIMGQVVAAPVISKKDKEVLLEVVELPSGIYFVKVNGMYAGKFLKE